MQYIFILLKSIFWYFSILLYLLYNWNVSDIKWEISELYKVWLNVSKLKLLIQVKILNENVCRAIYEIKWWCQNKSEAIWKKKIMKMVNTLLIKYFWWNTGLWKCSNFHTCQIYYMWFSCFPKLKIHLKDIWGHR